MSAIGAIEGKSARSWAKGEAGEEGGFGLEIGSIVVKCLNKILIVFLSLFHLPLLLTLEFVFKSTAFVVITSCGQGSGALGLSTLLGSVDNVPDGEADLLGEVVLVKGNGLLLGRGVQTEWDAAALVGVDIVGHERLDHVVESGQVLPRQEIED